MKSILVLLVLLGSASSFANTDLMEKARNISKESIGDDLRPVVSRIQDGICGGEGPSYQVEYQVRHLVRTEAGTFKDSWVTVKTYGISENELATQDAPVMMDAEACNE